MTKFCKFVRSLVAFILLALIITSCSANNGEEFPFVMVGSDTEAETGAYSLKYKVVVSASASGEILDNARDLAVQIGNATGAETTLVNDSAVGVIYENTHLVCVGYVDIRTVRERLSPLRTLDYICRTYGNVTVIGGRSDAATLTAVGRFINEILPVSDTQRLIPDGGGFEFIGEYSVDSLCVDGTDIRDYCLVVEHSYDSAAVDIAYSLSEKIAESFGFCLDIHMGSRPDDEKYIYVLTDGQCKHGRGVIERTERGIILRAADATGLWRVSDRFIGLLTSCGEAGSLSVNIPNTLYVPYGNTECTLAVTLFNALPDAPSPSFYTSLNKSVLGYSPDMLFCGALSDTERIALEEQLSGYVAESSDMGSSFAKNNIKVSKVASYTEAGLLCEAYNVECGELEFVLIYVSGSASDEIVINTDSLIGETSLPVIAMSYTTEEMTVSFEGRDFIEKVAHQSGEIYGKAVTYSCYADMRDLLVVEDEWVNDYGFCAVKVSLP